MCKAFLKALCASILVAGNVAFLPAPSLIGRSLARARTAHAGVRLLRAGKNDPKEAFDCKNIEHLFEANKKWAAEMKSKDKEYFTRMVYPNRDLPKYLWIGCSDARVPANEIVGLEPGQLYVHRNVANIIVNTDLNALSVLQYAVEFLEVDHIIVCGHYECGGVKASITAMDHTSPLENWIRNIRDVVRLHSEELLGIKEFKDRFRRLVELNVIEQCINVYKTAVVQRRRVFTHVKEGFATPRIHGVVYDPADGEIKVLEWNPKKYIEQLEQVYKLYDAEEEMKGYRDEPYEKRSGTLFNKPLFNRRPFPLS